MTFILGSIAMTAFALVWTIHHLFIKRDLHQHKEEIRIGGFFVGVWALVWWMLFT